MNATSYPHTSVTAVSGNVIVAVILSILLVVGLAVGVAFDKSCACLWARLGFPPAPQAAAPQGGKVAPAPAGAPAGPGRVP